MWFGTFNGVNKFNGYEFINYLSHAKDSTSLSHREANSIAEDGSGRVWIGTNDGLNLYNADHDNFIRIRLIWQNEVIHTTKINAMVVDRRNILWILSPAALYRIHLPSSPTLPSFLTIDEVFEAKEAFNLSEARFAALTLDSSANLWLASSTQALSCLNPENRTFRQIRMPADASPESIFKFLTYDPYNDAILIATCNVGLIVYSIQSGTVEFFNETNTEGMHDNLFLPFVAAPDTYWLPSDGKGLIVFDYKRRLCATVDQNPARSHLTELNSINSVCKDRNGNFWFGSSNNQGLSLYSPYRRKFSAYYREPYLENTLSHNLVMDFYQHTNDSLWICTDGGGLNMLNLRTNEYTHFFAGSTAPPTNKALSITGDRAGYLWLATWDGGISKLTASGELLYNYLDHCLPAEKELFDWPLQVITDSEDHLWIAFLKGGFGYYDKKANKIYSYRLTGEEPGEFISDFVTYLYEDSRKNIWVCTYNGLAYFNLAEADFSAPRPQLRFQYVLPERSGNSISSSEIASIVEDREGRYWIGHINHGLDRFDLGTDTFRNFSVKDGLPGNAIKGLVCDAGNQLWVFTSKGMARLSPEDNSLLTFDTHDGLRSLSIVGKPYMNREGEIFAGSIHGFNRFDPAEIRYNPNRPRPHITGLAIDGEVVRAGDQVNGRVVLSSHISDLDAITVSHKDDFIALQYVAIDYSLPEKTQYAYQLEGFDPDWVDAGNKREAVYRHLAPGTYTFRVKASNNEGGWNGAPAELRITVLPPWWRTWWFRILLGLGGGGIMVTFYFWRIRTLKSRQRQLEQKVQASTDELRKANQTLRTKNDRILQQQSEIVAQNTALKNQKTVLERIARELDEASRAKTNFFMNVSHEFRTPLTLILGPVESTLEQTAEETTRTQLQLVHQNAKRLLRLINQLLDLRSLETGTMQLRAFPGDVIGLTKSIFHSFDYLAERHRIRYELISDINTWETWFDPDILEKIGYNLLSNSFKYTPDGGTISVRVCGERIRESTAASDALTIQVTDSGIGIGQDHLEKIFEPFYRIDHSNFRRNTGTGIGLSLVKELALMHKGTVEVHSVPGQGSAFTVRLAVGEGLLTTGLAGKDAASVELTHYPHITDTGRHRNTRPGLNARDATDGEKPGLLVVEDNADIIDYITYSLESEYHVMHACNGREAQAKVLECQPDVVVSDIMMPVMDGIELAGALKADERTSHIPIILLTARAEETAQIAGLQTGADDYLTKPFNIDILKIKLGNLIEVRQRLIRKFRAELCDHPTILATSQTDEKFLARVSQVIERNIGNSQFNAQELGKEVGMSRAHLYRKMQLLTNQSVNEFIRTIRLKKAAGVLTSVRPCISELAYSLGFNSPQYFTRCFKEEFGVSPSEFMEKQHAH